MKKLLCLIMAFMMILTSVSAMADPAKVQTPSGPLNMRSEPDTKKGKVIKQIKNGATVTVLEQVDEDWTKVSYSGKEGYVQTRFLNLTVAAEGKTIYADASDHLYLRQKKSDTAKIVGYVSYTQPLTILEVDDEWTKVSAIGSEMETVEGWIRTERIANQYTEPQEAQSASTVQEAGILRSKQKLYEFPSKSSSVVATISKGDPVTILSIEGDWCHVRVDSIISGYINVSNIHLTGEAAPEEENYLLNYTGVCYLCTVPSGKLTTYVEPTKDVKGDVKEVITVDPAEKLRVIQTAYSSHGKKWAKVLYNGQVHWVLSSNLKISQETESVYCSQPIQGSTPCVVYAGKNGTTVYSSASRYSKTLGKVKAGTELSGSAYPGYISVTYNGKNGYVFYSDVVLGVAQYIDHENGWYYFDHMNDPAPEPTATPAPTHDDSVYISADDARSKADAALTRAYPSFSAKGMSVKYDRIISKAGSSVPIYEFAYFKNDKYMYCARINALDGSTVYTADYSDFGSEPSQETKKPSATPIPGEITRSEARSIADSKLNSTYDGFSNQNYNRVENKRFSNMPGYDEPVYRLVYYTNDQHAYTCVVGAKSGSVLYHTNVWNSADTEIDYSEPEATPDYSGAELISESRARSIADSTLTRKYPEFAGAGITSVNAQLDYDDGAFETPHYQFDYFINGQLAYTCIVHAVTEKVLYTYGDIPGEVNG